MSIRFITFIFVLFISLLFTGSKVLAKEIAIYRWIDKNNVVHFSQNQPSSENYSQLSVFSEYKATSREDRLVLAQQALANEKNKQDLATIKKAEALKKEQELKNIETYKKNCKAAKLNIKMLNSFDKVLYTDPNGTSRVLGDKEKKEQLSLSKKHIDIYCEQKNN